MPTGLTADIYEGKSTSLRAFALNCARQLGGGYQASDYGNKMLPMDKPPVMEPSGYHREQLKKAEEDFNVATFLYEDAKKNLDQVISVFDNLEKLSSENERTYENHLREVCIAEEMFREIEKEIQAFEKKITQDFEEMTNVRKLLISFGL